MPIQTPITRGEAANLNPVLTGVIQEVLPSDFGFQHNILFPKKLWKSNGDGRGFFRRRLHQDALREITENELIRRPGSSAKKVDRDMGLTQFAIKRRHLDAVVSNDEADMLAQLEGSFGDPNVTEVRWIKELMLLAKERRAAAFTADNTNFGGTAAAAALWSLAGTDIVSDIVAMQLAVRQQSGYMANCFAVSYEAALAATKNTSVKAIRGTVAAQDFTVNGLAEMFKRAFGFEKVTILTSIYNPTKRNATGTYSLANVWGGSAIAYYEPKEGASFDRLSWTVDAIDTFYYDGIEGGVYSFEEKDSESMIHRVKEDSDFVLNQKEVAYKLTNIVV